MRVPPDRPTAQEVLDTVRRHWAPGARMIVHLPLGFGAHHWRVDGDGQSFFATLDVISPTRTAESFERAYRGAQVLGNASLRGVHPSLPSHDGRLTIECGGGLLSVATWIEGRSPTSSESEREQHRAQVLALLAGLHGSPAPPGIDRWVPRVAERLAERVAGAVTAPWASGPCGESARKLLSDHLLKIDFRERRYWELRSVEERAADRRVPTHGEPHASNQMLSGGELLFVDWETLALAPRERDLTGFPAAVRRAQGADPEMIEMFELEWTLSEIEEYQRWFRAPHTGGEDDLIALEDLREELQR